jgi:hypothetical protein
MKILILLLLPILCFGQSRGKGKIIYKYKKYEKFDFSDIEIGGGPESIGDLSINPRSQKKFRNRLPLRKNFNPELRESIETLR